MESASTKRLRWALMASVAAHVAVLAWLPVARVAASRAAEARPPMRVVRVYQAAVIPPQLVSAPALAASALRAAVAAVPSRKAASPARASTRKRDVLKPKPAERETPLPPPRPAPASTAQLPVATSPPVAPPIRLGPPESLALQRDQVAHLGAAGGLVLAEPGPLPGRAIGAEAGAGETTGSGDPGAGRGGASGEAGPAPAEATVSPSAVSLPKPRYPDECRRRGQEGTVRLRALVLRDGSVGRAEVVRSSGVAAFDRAAREGVRNWRFRPARRGDAPIDAWVTLSVVFRLEDADR